MRSHPLSGSRSTLSPLSVIRGRAFALGLTMAFLCLLGGCSIGGQAFNRPAPDRRFYTIDVSRPQSAPPAQDKTVLKVRPLRISPAYQDRMMVYRMDETRYVSDYYNAFFVQPAIALTQTTRDWLGRTGIFGNVVDSTSQVMDTHLLEGMVNFLFADFRDRANPKAVLEMQFFLLKNANDAYSVIFSKSYRQEVPFTPTAGNAGALAEAYAVGLTRILGELEADLRTVKK